MAVSPQYLRPITLLDSTRAYLTPQIIRGASSVVHEPESAIRLALNSAVPSLLAGLSNFASSPEGIDRLSAPDTRWRLFTSCRQCSRAFRGRDCDHQHDERRAAVAREDLRREHFRGFGSAWSSSGIRASSAASLLGMMAPLVLGVIGKHATSQGLNASGVANLLVSQKQSIFGALPAGMSQLVGLSGPRVVTSNANSANGNRSVAQEMPRQAPYIGSTVPAEANMKKWLWIGLIAFAGLLLWLFARGRGPGEAMTRISLPNGTSLSVPDGSLTYNLANYLSSGSQDVPRGFVFDHLNFQTSSADLTPDSVQTVHDLTEIMKAYPNVQFQLAGHTDNTGDADANQRLSVDRANAVKSMLVSGGIRPQRISTTGYGQMRPIAINDTDEGRAEKSSDRINRDQ